MGVPCLRKPAVWVTGSGRGLEGASRMDRHGPLYSVPWPLRPHPNIFNVLEPHFLNPHEGQSWGKQQMFLPEILFLEQNGQGEEDDFHSLV